MGNDGFIDKEDLKDTYGSLGRAIDDKTCDEMLAEGNGPVNFQVFLGMFGNKISGTDPEETILNAFKTLDEAGAGAIHKDAPYPNPHHASRQIQRHRDATNVRNLTHRRRWKPRLQRPCLHPHSRSSR